ncbi:hypothetical protein KSF_063260 [Reticulibacter mediterranei]|uniref:Peptidase metallopeptidase domain-containing protein n=1 Tax=Reticulibacter mediterranei TaxID=2778369 RepID=A0A8J3N599_9CHLR|nr:M12 family metallopeptidase [Reticulibacter mediterranei]GHO96278.1 hypothetical protein KSF_063260 [Reticulibacter mediterranei]
MSESMIKFYFERTLPLRYRQPSSGETKRDNFEAAAEKALRWETRTLYVTFLDGDPRVHKRVEKYAKQWCEHANIDFVFRSHPSPQIRISFKDKFTWSYIGRECEQIPLSQPTMNFGWLKHDSSDKTYSAAVLHEFGHALGLIHEHQRPDIEIQWNRPAVFAYFKSLEPPWPDTQIEWNIFHRYDEGQTQYNEFDPHSIMIYRIDPGWTCNQWGVEENSELSQTDKDFIRQLYP